MSSLPAPHRHATWLASSDLPTEHGLFAMHVFRNSLGVHAVPYLAARLRPIGFNVSTGDSHRRIDGRYHALLETLAAEAAQVAAQVQPARAADVAEWVAQRSADLADGVLSLQVGHMDLLARPG